MGTSLNVQIKAPGNWRWTSNHLQGTFKIEIKKNEYLSAIRMYGRDSQHLQQPHTNMCSIPTSTITTK